MLVTFHPERVVYSYVKHPLQNAMQHATMISFFDNFNILSDKQHGFRMNQSLINADFQLILNYVESIDKKIIFLVYICIYF